MSAVERAGEGGGRSAEASAIMKEEMEVRGCWLRLASDKGCTKLLRARTNHRRRSEYGKRGARRASQFRLFR